MLRYNTNRAWFSRLLYIDFISQHSAATTETHTNDIVNSKNIVKKIKRENKKLKYKIKKS